MFDSNKLKKVRQANEFVESPYSMELTIHEIKIMEHLIAECKEEDYKLIGLMQGKNYTFSATQLAKILNTSVSRIVTDGDKLANNITQKRIIQKTFNSKKQIDEFLYLPIIISAQYKSGLFSFELNYKILPFFININKNFTEYQIHYIYEMNSPYAIKLYKLLYQYKKISKRVFSVEELKTQFGIKDKYPNYKNFKQRVLEPSIMQINEKTDLYVNYEEKKFGRKVDKIIFMFTPQNRPIHLGFVKHIDNINEIIDVESASTNTDVINIDELISKIKSNISTSTKKIIVEYYKVKGSQYIEASIDYALKNAKSNIDKYLSDTLLNGWCEVELNKKIEKKLEYQKQKLLKEKEEQEKLSSLETEMKNKYLIDSDWNDLSEENKKKYENRANQLICKYKHKLDMFSNINMFLPLCVFAVSNNKTYDSVVENYMKHMLGVDLSIEFE